MNVIAQLLIYVVNYISGSLIEGVRISDVRVVFVDIEKDVIGEGELLGQD